MRLNIFDAAPQSYPDGDVRDGLEMCPGLSVDCSMLKQEQQGSMGTDDSDLRSRVSDVEVADRFCVTRPLSKWNVPTPHCVVGGACVIARRRGGSRSRDRDSLASSPAKALRCAIYIQILSAQG